MRDEQAVKLLKGFLSCLHDDETSAATGGKGRLGQCLLLKLFSSPMTLNVFSFSSVHPREVTDLYWAFQQTGDGTQVGLHAHLGFQLLLPSPYTLLQFP